MPLKPEQLLDPIPETRDFFRKRLRRAPIDFESFATPLRLCTLEGCRGMCCYDGVCLDDDEEHYLTAIVNAHPLHFEPLGITIENAFEDAVFIDTDTRKTASAPCEYPEHVGFPKHFENTRCIFRHPDGRCSLQGLAMEHGEHPWAYKPLSCWLHPISLERNDRTILWLPTMGKDPLRDEDFPGYAPFTQCGEYCEGGRPAYEVLRQEIETLGAVVGRDFYGEIKEALKDFPTPPPPVVEEFKPKKEEKAEKKIEKKKDKKKDKKKKKKKK